MSQVAGSIGGLLSALEARGALRYERKFRLPTLWAAEVEARLRLHPAGFREVYADRRVQNLYFDTPDLRCYRDNVDGASRRFKVRVRWYGDEGLESGRIEAPALEIKGRVGLLGSKARFALPPISTLRNPDPFLDPGLAGPAGLGARDFQALFEAADLPQALKIELRMLRPVLANAYRRRYYLAGDPRFRLTIDRQMHFAGVDGLGRSLAPRSVGRGASGVVVELKYGLEAAPDLSAVVGELPSG